MLYLDYLLRQDLLQHISDLKGKVLVCDCRDGDLCEATVLAAEVYAQSCEEQDEQQAQVARAWPKGMAAMPRRPGGKLLRWLATEALVAEAIPTRMPLRWQQPRRQPPR